MIRLSTLAHFLIFLTSGTLPPFWFWVFLVLGTLLCLEWLFLVAVRLLIVIAEVVK